MDENHTMHTRRLLTPFLTAALLSLLTATAAAQSLPRFGAPDPHVKAELVAATDAVVPGQPLQVGLRLKHENEWHTYWQVPGDSGLPTRIEWQLPAGMTAGPIEWPHPHRLPAGPLMNFGYEGDTLLLTTVKVGDVKAGTPVTLNAKAEWLECKDVCIPGGADLSLTLPVKAASVAVVSCRLVHGRAQAGASDGGGPCGARHDRVQPHPPRLRSAIGQQGRCDRVLPARRSPRRACRRAGAEPQRWRGALPDGSTAREGRRKVARRGHRRQRRPGQAWRLDGRRRSTAGGRSGQRRSDVLGQPRLLQRRPRCR